MRDVFCATTTPNANEAPFDPAERLSVQVTPLSGEPPSTLSASASEGCDFFEGRRSELLLTGADGTTRMSFAWDPNIELARDATGELWHVVWTPTSPPSIQVKKNCEPTSIDPGFSVVIPLQPLRAAVTVGSQPMPTRELPVAYARESVSEECVFPHAHGHSSVQVR